MKLRYLRNCNESTFGKKDVLMTKLVKYMNKNHWSLERAKKYALRKYDRLIITERLTPAEELAKRLAFEAGRNRDTKPIIIDSLTNISIYKGNEKVSEELVINNL